MKELIQLAENTFYIQFYAKVGVYRLNDHEAVLIDSGNTPKDAQIILKLLDEAGLTPVMILNTHSHADHIGGNKTIQDATGCKIYNTMYENWIANNPEAEPVYLYGGHSQDHFEVKPFLAQPSRSELFTPEILPEGFDYYTQPGHSFSMIGIKTPDDVWFLADSLLSCKELNKYPLSFMFDVAGHLRTLDRLPSLTGKLFVPSHASATEDITELIAVNRQAVFDNVALICELTQEPATAEDIEKGFFDRYEIPFSISQYIFLGCTIKSYIAYMLDMNYIEPEPKDNRLYYRCVHQPEFCVLHTCTPS